MPLQAAYSTSRRSTSRATQAVLQECEHVAQVGAHVPRAAHVVDAETPLLRVDADAHVGGIGVVANDDDLRDVLLHVVERREEHLLRLDALRIDVAVADGLEDLVHDLELREIVRCGRMLGGDVRRGNRRCEPLPQSAAVQVLREEAGYAEGADQGAELRESFEDSHFVF